MQRRQMLLISAIAATFAAASASAYAMFPATTKGGGTTIGFPDVCKIPQTAVEKLPPRKAPTKAEIAAVRQGLDGIMASVSYADGFLAKSKEPKAKVEEARKVLVRVRELHALAVKAIESTPADDKTGRLRQRLAPILQELCTIPYPPLLRPARG